MTWLIRVYEAYPRRVSLLELLIFFGILVTYLWIVPFWFWGFYLLDIPLPDSLSEFFYKIWLEKNIIRAFLVALLVFFIPLSIYIRRTSLREMGIRADNIWISGRECLCVILLLFILFSTIIIMFHNSLSIDSFFAKQQETRRNLISDIPIGILSGLVQQFLLQCFLLQRTLKIFKNEPMAILSSSFLFSIIHAPNIILMTITFFFGAMCSFLFMRNRNILTLGITHGIAQQTLRVLFSSIIASSSYFGGSGYLKYNLSVGPRKGYPEYLARLEYKGSLPLTASASGGAIFVPVSVTNMSTKRWSSTDGSYLVSVGYHLVDEKGNVVSAGSPLTPFDKPIEPGDSETVKLMVSVPSKTGDYHAEIDIAHPGSGSNAIFWFELKGSKTITVPISVR